MVKKRPSTPEKKFKPPSKGEKIYRYGIVSRSGETVSSHAAGPCFNVVFQTKGKSGKFENVIWHVLPSKVQFFFPPSKKRNPYGDNAAVREKYKKMLRDKLDKRESVDSSVMGEIGHYDAVDVILDHLHSLKDGPARVSATIVPGSHTLEDTYTKEALEKVKSVLDNAKKERRIHNVRTKGLTPQAVRKGASEVYVDGDTGRIHRRNLND